MKHPIKSLCWRFAGVVDKAVAVPFYLFVPRHIRNRWMMPGTLLRNQHAYDEVRAVLGDIPRALVLDVGGGIAALAETLGAGRGVRVVTLDLELGLLQKARAKLARALLVCADGSRLPFRDGTFDAVVMVHALEHIPEEIRDQLASEIKRVSRRGVVIHGPAGPDAIRLTRAFIDELEARGMEVPRYAREHLAFSMPMPAWFTQAFPGCRVEPRRNLDVEFATLVTAYTPVVRWLGGLRHARMAPQDSLPPFVEYTMIWKRTS